MGKIDKLIKNKLAQKAKYSKLEPTPACPSDMELSEYISGMMDKTKKEALEKHLAECFLCLDKIVSAYEGQKLLTKKKLKKPPKEVTWKAKNIERITGGRLPKAPAAKKSATTKQAVKKWLPKNLKKNKWLIASITAFALSFAFPPVFFQFLLAAGILGGKWIFDSQNAKLLVMIYDAWKKGGEKEVSDMLKTLKDRIPTKK